MHLYHHLVKHIKGCQDRLISLNDVLAVPTKSLNQRHVTVSTKDLTLDARFTIAAELRNQAANRQSKGREAVLAKKRGLPGPNKTAKQVSLNTSVDSAP